MSVDNQRPGSGRPPDGGAGDDDLPPEERTQRMPPELLPERLPAPRPVRVAGSGGSRKPLWIGVLAVVLVVAVIGGGVAYALRGHGGGGSGPHGCASNTPCSVADAYLLAYTGFKFEQMYGYTSAYSRQQFSDPKILGSLYKDAHDYIVNRTANILSAAEVYSLSATPGNVVTNGPSAATVPARIVMQSTRVGSFTQDISILLVLEGGNWHVNWTPGLIFPQLDDPNNDPTYSRLVYLQPANAARGTIYDAAGDALAKDDPTTGKRVYPYGEALAAVTGFVGLVNQQDINNDPTHYYEPTDQIGRAGVEQWGELYLRPTKGGALGIYNRNADGTRSQQPVYTVATRAAAPGDDIHTTIDLKSQQAAIAAIQPRVGSGSNQGKDGAAFAVDPTTGAVLVMASYPMYDPNQLSQGITSANDVYLNRAVQDPKPTGSVFKLVDLAAALQNGISKSDTFTCHGSYLVPGESKPRPDDSGGGHGTLTAPQALAPSCDVIFWQVAIKLNSMDPNILPNMAKAMGLGAPTGVVGVPAEDAGLVPDPAYATSQGSTWNASWAADLGIGEGDFQATPAQIAMMSAAIADNGTRMQPRLVSQVTSSSGAVVQTYAPKKLGTLPISADNLAVLQVAMYGTVETPAGTTYNVFKGFKVSVAGKTGTAALGNGAPPHAWFTCYAPFPPLSGPPVTPTIAMSVEVQNSGYGEIYAAPVCRAVLSSFFNVS